MTEGESGPGLRKAERKPFTTILVPLVWEDVMPGALQPSWNHEDRLVQ